MGGLRGRFLLLVVGIVGLVGALAAFGFLLETRAIVRELVSGYAVQVALEQRGRLEGRLGRELVLAQKLADSPLLKSWGREESDPERKRLALEELESYRRLFADHSWFCAFEPGRRFYFNNARNEFAGQELRYTLRRENPGNGWYFHTLGNLTDYGLHVDHDPALNVSKLWINVIIKAGQEKLGVAGSGLDLSDFLSDLVRSTAPGVQTVLLDRQGAIQAHPDEALMRATANQFDESRRPTLESLVDEPDRPGLRAALAGRAEVERFEVHTEGKLWLGAAARMPDLGWTVVVLVDPRQAVHTHLFLPILILFACALLGTAGLVSWSLDRLILARLARLTGWARALAEGRYETDLPPDRADEIGALTGAFGHMAATIRKHTHHLEERVQERTAELESSNRKLVDSLHYARLIQTALLARRTDLARLLPDQMVFWRPREIVGGDFYALYEDETGFALAVADCTGHGVPGACMTMASKALLDRAVAARGLTDPAALLADVHRALRTLLQQEEPGSRNGLELALARVLPAEGRIQFASAGLSLWIQGPDGTFTELRGERQSLGYAGAPELSFTNREWTSKPGQRFFLLTDGLLDQAGGPQGYGLGRRSLQEALTRWKDEPLTGLEAALEAFVRDYQGERPQRDDMTLLGFRLGQEDG